MISGLRQARIGAAEQVLHRGGRDHGARPQRVERDPACLNSPAMPSTHMLMPNFAIV